MGKSIDTAWVYKGRVPCLDGYRGIGALLIIFGHSALRSGMPIPGAEWLFESVGLGNIAVHLFFVLSGFLITLLLLREFNSRGEISLRSFYVRRILRLVPAYAAYLLVMGLLHLADVLAITKQSWVAALTYTVNFHASSLVNEEFAHFWTLSVEEHFYFVWPAILAFLGLTAGRWALALCILLGPLERYFLYNYNYKFQYIDGGHCTFSKMDVIAFGAGLAFLCQSENFRRLTARLQPICGWLVVCASVGLVGSNCLSNLSWNYKIFAHHTITGILSVVIIYFAAAFSNKWVWRILEWRPLVLIGVTSYSLYIWQQPFTTHDGLPSWCRAWPQNWLFIAIAGMLSYFVVERLFLRIKDHDRRKRNAEPEKPLVALGVQSVTS